MAALGVSCHLEDAEDTGQTHQTKEAHVHVEALDQHLVQRETEGEGRGGGVSQERSRRKADERPHTEGQQVPYVT
jgi:hypothetical protein